MSTGRSTLRLTRTSVQLVAAGGGLVLLAAALAALLADAPVDAWRYALGLFVLAAGQLGTSLVVTYLTMQGVVDDVGYVSASVRAMARGERIDPIPVRTLDEIGQLTRRLEDLRVSFLRRLADEREHRRDAEVADRYKTEFLTAVSHELRTPLNAILGFADVLLSEMDGPLTGSQREDLTIIKTSGEHLMSLFNDVLDLSAAASGRLTLDLARVEVGPLLDEIASELRVQLADKPVSLSADAGGVPDVHADPRRIRQVLRNLGSNAVKFTESGEIRLIAEIESGGVVIRVRDTGVGIDATELGSIFEEFRQATLEDRRKRGSGLGLAIARQLVTLHGGRLEVDSLPGKGSTFSLWLPRCEEDAS